MIRLKAVRMSRCRFLNRRRLKSAVSAVLKSLSVSDAELSIVFAGDDEIRALNKRYCRRDAPTDVLSFAMGEGRRVPGDSKVLGDIVISVDRAREQAKDFGTSFREEIGLYVIHGLLHLLGYNDEEPRRRRKMREKERELFPLWHRRAF